MERSKTRRLLILHLLLLLLPILGWLTGASTSPPPSSINDDDDDDRELSGPPTETIVLNCSVWYRRVIRSSDVFRLRLSAPPSDFSQGSFLLLRLHSFARSVLLFSSLSDAEDPSSYANGTDVGMVLVISSKERDLSWHFRSALHPPSSPNYTVIFRVDLYPPTAPVPGGCNNEFSPAIAPQIKTSLVNEVLMEGTFQYARISSNSSQKRHCDRHRHRVAVRYTVFVLTLSVGDLTFDSYASTLQRMSTPGDIRRRGFHVMSFPAAGFTTMPPRFYLPIVRTQGILIAIVAENLNEALVISEGESGGEKMFQDVVNGDNYTAAYVSTINYGCDVAADGSCFPRYDLSTYFVLPALLLLGFISTFLGHHYFRFHLALYSFLCFAFFTVVVVGNTTQLSLENTAWYAAGAGCLGSLLMVWLWWYSGLPLPCAAASGLVLGYLLASVVVTIPTISLLLSSPRDQRIAFFIIGVVPLFFIYWARALNVVATSVCGSYVAWASLDLLTTTRLSQILWQNILGSVFPDKIPLLLRLGPISTLDAVVISAWVVVALLGICFQWLREKNNPPFPPHRNLTEDVMEGRLEATPLPAPGEDGGSEPEEFTIPHESRRAELDAEPRDASSPHSTLGFRMPRSWIRRPMVRDRDGNVALLPSTLNRRAAPNYGATSFGSGARRSFAGARSKFPADASFSRVA